MPLRRQLVIFLRAPQRGAAKQRLARGIGTRAAHDFYHETSRALIARLGRDRRWNCILAVTPDHFAHSGRFWGPPARGLLNLGQGTGGLGARMGRVFATLDPGPVVMIGADIPSITPMHIAEAFHRLDSREAVFGPAADGGYWLVGLARKRLKGASAQNLFRRVRWSTASALEDTRANLPRGFEAMPLEILEDVDDVNGWERNRNFR